MDCRSSRVLVYEENFDATGTDDVRMSRGLYGM